MTNTNAFVTELCKNKKMEEARQDFIDFWEEYEANTVLFGAFGRAISDSFNEINRKEKERIFLLIEENVNSDDEHLGTCIATGLLEALYNVCHEVDNWDDVKQFLGKNSMGYIEAWIEATGG